MNDHWISVDGIVVKGYRVASGPSADYPYGALDRQRPFLKAGGLDLDRFFNGTLNINIRPDSFKMVNPEYTFHDVEWTDLHPPEHFSFSHCKVVHSGKVYNGWVYYPHPETKLRNFQNPSLLEVIAEPIPTLHYDDKVRVELDPSEITIFETTDQ